jgi:uncharacterized delta-60 repeat protein
MKPPTCLTLVVSLIALSNNYSAELDPTFAANVQGTVHALGVDGSGKILVGGEFAQVNGVSRNNLALLDARGAIDGSFGVQTDGAVLTVALDAGGMAYVGGAFNAPGRHLVRLLPSGEVAPLGVGSSTSSRVDCLAIGGGGAVAFGGPFRNLNGAASVYAGRLNADGAIDATFGSSLLPTMSIEAGVDAIAVQADGKVIVGGNFNTASGFATLVRLNQDGSIDATFSGDHGAILYTRAIVVLGNGQVLVAGVADSSGKGFVRLLNPDGSVDSSFEAPEFDDSVEALALEGEGLLVGGSFSGGLVRLDATGEIDPAWNIAADGVVKAIAMQGDDAVIVGGSFQTIGGQAQTGLARLKLRGALLSTNANGRFQGRIQGEAGKTYEIESSSDLKNWAVFGTATATDTGIEIDDAISTDRTQRFYRARLIN